MNDDGCKVEKHTADPIWMRFVFVYEPAMLQLD